MKIGKHSLHIIESGYFALDGGAMFGIIPKPLWERTNPADESNRIKLATRNLLLISDSKKILIDTGMGDKWDEKSKKIYSINQQNSLENSLTKLNIKYKDITDIILTHLHFDHTGGSTIMVNDKFIPAFSNAKYHVSKKNFDWAVNSTERDKGSYLKENFLPLFKSGVLNFLPGNDNPDSENRFDDEIEFIEVNGHTFGQYLIKVSDMHNTILYCGDLFPTTSHIPIPYVMGYDLQPLITIEEKKKILTKAVEENWKLFFEHDPFYAFAAVEINEKGFKVKEKYESF